MAQARPLEHAVMSMEKCFDLHVRAGDITVYYKAISIYCFSTCEVDLRMLAGSTSVRSA